MLGSKEKSTVSKANRDELIINLAAQVCSQADRYTPKIGGRKDGENLLPVASDGLKFAVVSAEGDVESDDSIASLDELQVLFGDASLCGSTIIEHSDLLEETRLVVLIVSGASGGDGLGSSAEAAFS